ncbi:PAS domain-containing protein [Nostoc sphaeroides]
MPIVVIEWSLEFMVRGCNPSADKIFGYTIVQVMGRSLDFLIAIDQLPIRFG